MASPLGMEARGKLPPPRMPCTHIWEVEQVPDGFGGHYERRKRIQPQIYLEVSAGRGQPRPPTAAVATPTEVVAAPKAKVVTPTGVPAPTRASTAEGKAVERHETTGPRNPVAWVRAEIRRLEALLARPNLEEEERRELQKELWQAQGDLAELTLGDED